MTRVDPSGDEPLDGEDRTRARRVIRAAHAAGCLPPSWMLVGDEGIGKRSFAEWMLRLIWCRAESERPCGACASCRQLATGNHPDLVVVQCDPPPELDPLGLGSRHEITVGQVRELVLASLALRSVAGHGRAALIVGAEALNVEAQNALLKVLEEPPPGGMLLLVTAHEESLLDTVRSRCHELRLAPLSDAAMRRVAGGHPESLRRLARGRPGRLQDLVRLEAEALLLDFDRLLAGQLSGLGFGQAMEARLARGVEQGGDEQHLRRSSLELLQARLAEHLLAAQGGRVAGLERSAFSSDQSSINIAFSMEKAIFEALTDLRRHLPPGLAWAALGFDFQAAGVGASSGPARYT